MNPVATAALHRMSAAVLARTGDVVLSQKVALGMMYSQVQHQALALSYFDMFRLFAFASFAVIPLVLLMKRSVAEKGAEAAVH